MSYLDTPHKKKSAVLTTIIMALVLFFIFSFGMTYLDPPEEYGIAINFGTSDVGSGSAESEPDSGAPPEEVVEEVVQEEVEEVEPVQEAVPEPVSTPTKAEDVATQDNAETIRINKKKEAKRKADEAERKLKDAERQAKRKVQEAERKAKLKADRIKKQKQAAEAKKRAAAAKKKREQDAKRKGVDGLFDGLNKGSGKGTGKGKGKNGVGGDGDDNKAGNKGQLNGTPYGNSYYGSGSGRGSGSGYGLKGRTLKKSGQGFKQDCNEYGKVVVKIEVDKNGKVVRATPGVKGSTNTAPCLMAPAKKSAMTFRWNVDSKAPSKQVGFVIVKFN